MTNIKKKWNDGYAGQIPKHVSNTVSQEFISINTNGVIS